MHGHTLSFDKAAPERPAGRGIFDVRIDGVSLPCQKPPWGRVIAINGATGDIAWQTTLGIINLKIGNTTGERAAGQFPRP